MKASAEAIPEFENELFHFKTFFAFTDLALNDSTIQPINLSLPNRRKTPKNDSIEGAPLSPAPPKDGTSPGRRRFLRPQVLNSGSTPVDTRPAPIEARPAPVDTRPAPVVAPPPKVEPPKHAEPKNEEEVEERAQPVAVDQEEEEPNPKQVSRPGWPPQMMEITEENMHRPIPEGYFVAIEFHMKAEKSSNWKIVDCKTNNVAFHATRSGKIGSYTVKLCWSGKPTPVAVLTSNFTHNAFYANANVDGTNLEIAALGFKMQKKNGLKVRRFRARIPKPESEIPASDKSTLLKHKEIAFNMKPKPPKIKGGIPVLYFGGRVKMQSTRNHILISKEMDGNLLVFGKASPKVFIGEFYHPLSPVQGICLCMPHFK